MIDNYDALTLGTYMRVNAALEGPGDDLEKQVQILSILSDRPEDELLLLPLADYANMAKQSAFLREHCKPTQIGEGYTYQGLVPTRDFRKINTAQYIDFQTFAKGFPGSLPQLLSVFLVPEGHAYNDGYDMAAVQEKVGTMPFADALGLAAFFFAQFLKLTRDSLTSWEEQVRITKDKTEKEKIVQKMMEVQELLQISGVGLRM